jgi:hypothetical protein
MTPIRALLWAGVGGWALIALNFTVAFLRRRSLVRFTWALAALAGVYLELYRLGVPPPYLARVGLDVALAMGGLGCGLALTVTLARKGWGVLR